MSVSGQSVSDSEIDRVRRWGKEGKIYRESVREATNYLYSYMLYMSNHDCVDAVHFVFVCAYIQLGLPPT